MGTHGLAGRLVAALVAVILVGGCAAAGPSPTSTPTPTETLRLPPTPTETPAPTQTETPEPSPTLLPSPKVWGQAVLVTGNQNCSAVPWEFTTDASGTTHETGGFLHCIERANDPRVSGDAKGPFDFNGWGGSVSDGAEVFSDTIRLVNDGGAWEGRYTGIYTSETGDLWSIWYTGTGAYAGLSYYEWIKEPVGSLMDFYPITGLIFPGTLPTP